VLTSTCPLEEDQRGRATASVAGRTFGSIVVCSVVLLMSSLGLEYIGIGTLVERLRHRRVIRVRVR